MRFLGTSATFLTFAATRKVAASIGPVADLRITNQRISPDGFTRSAVLAGDTFPGPVIRGKKGDHFKINVINDLTDGSMSKTTSIHWHGLHMKGYNWADGGAMINQCPIASGNSFRYEMPVPSQAGTFWYHSHYKAQYCDGLRGALVVEDPNDPHKALYDVDDDSTIITLADWYHDVSPNDAQRLLALPASILINGKGRYGILSASPAELAVVNVQWGTRYRLRIIAMSCDPKFTFSIDRHPLTIIEADGENTQPLAVDSLVISAGQRYSVVLNANQTVNNYWIRAEPSLPGTPSLPSLPFLSTDTRNKAILRYKGARKGLPTTASRIDKSLREIDLHPLENPVAPGAPHINGADVNINLIMGLKFKTLIPPSIEWSLNGAPFHPPNLPVLLQILSGAQDASTLMPKSSIISLPRKKTIQVAITQPAAGGIAGTLVGMTHPFHLHGHSFSVIRSAGSSRENYANPVRRDVVDTGGLGDNVTIRFRTDNPGPWFLHCHIDWHLEAGLAVIFAEDTPGTSTFLNRTAPASTAAWENLCPIWEKLTPEQKGAA